MSTIKPFFLLLVLALSSLALAQHQTQQEALTENPSAISDATSSCDVTFLSGSGETATKLCVTANGNIAQFSVQGQEMIAVGVIGEGYGICDETSNVAYYDYAYEDSGNWDPATFSQSGNVITVTRLTKDGIWQLKQTITNVAATATSPGSVKVSMALKNLSGVSRFAYILRYADVDAASDNKGNDFDYTLETAYGLEPSFNRGLGLTNGTFTFDHQALAEQVFDGPAPCNLLANLAPQPFHGDGAIVQFWDFTVAKNTSKTVVSTYKPI